MLWYAEFAHVDEMEGPSPKTFLRHAMLGMIPGSGHPLSWLAINWYAAQEPAGLPSAPIHAYRTGGTLLSNCRAPIMHSKGSDMLANHRARPAPVFRERELMTILLAVVESSRIGGAKARLMEFKKNLKIMKKASLGLFETIANKIYEKQARWAEQHSICIHLKQRDLRGS